jgi:hypothetical protein
MLTMVDLDIPSALKYASMLDTHNALTILNEIEAEYVRLGTTLCNNLKNENQLAAVILLGLRSTSLLKSYLLLIQPTMALAGCDAVARAFLEASSLQFEFRFLDSKKKIEKWFTGKGDGWKSDKGRLNSFFQAQIGSGFGREYERFSASTHPIVSACRNSVAIVTSARGINANSQQLQQAVEMHSRNFANLLDREIVITLVNDLQLIEMPIEWSNLPLCVAFRSAFIEFLKEERQKAPCRGE